MTDLDVSPSSIDESSGERRAGETLRSTRESLGMSIPEVAYSLKLNARQVEAIESGRFDLLPGAAFTRGFLRNYARLLKIDPAPLLAGLEPPPSDATVELAPASNAHGNMPEVGRGRFRRSVLPGVLAALALLGIVVVGWYYDTQKSKPQEDLVASLPAAQEPAFAPAAQGGEGGAAVPPASEPAPVAVPVPVQPAVPAPASTPPVAAAPESVSAKEASVTSPAPAPEAPKAGGDKLVFDFAQDSWVEVKDPAGKVVFSRLGKAGTREQIDVKAPISVVIGNARGVKLERNGAPVDLGLTAKATVARLKIE
ncbi:helix-turn-helix domain-containing protein [Zoogloea sp.]|uniref:helix-turn-helix domain-containing protein n=1 Tax=Zoogloea sp. TaxID=49181 RepID=UPI0014165C8F|nr:MAG: helix-turn-helix domain-containing protein [Zoogloea sp.]